MTRMAGSIELVEADLHRGAVVGDGLDLLDLPGRGADRDPGRVRADPLDGPARQQRLGGVAEVVQAVLEAGAAEVGDEDFHVTLNPRRTPRRSPSRAAG